MNKVNYKEAVKLLNGMCAQLGVAFNYNACNAVNKEEKFGKYELSKWVHRMFYWSKTPQQHEFWQEISSLLLDIEKGEGIKNESIIKNAL